MADTITETLPTKTKPAKKAPSGKPDAKTVKAVVAKVKADVKKKAVKLNKEQEEYVKTLTKEEQTYYREHGTLRGLKRKGKFEAPQLSTAAELKEKRGTPLRKAQAHILYVLSKARGPLTLKQIMETSMVEPSWGRWWLGIQDPEQRAISEKKWNFSSLVTMKAAKWVEVEVEGRTVSCAEITPTGRKLMEEYDKVQKEADKPTAEKDIKDKRKEKDA